MRSALALCSLAVAAAWQLGARVDAPAPTFRSCSRCGLVQALLAAAPNHPGGHHRHLRTAPHATIATPAFSAAASAVQTRQAVAAKPRLLDFSEEVELTRCVQQLRGIERALDLVQIDVELFKTLFKTALRGAVNASPEQMEQLFEQYDANGNGLLDLNELQACHETAGCLVAGLPRDCGTLAPADAADGAAAVRFPQSLPQPLLAEWASAANVSVAELCTRVDKGRKAEARLVEANVRLVGALVMRLKRSSGGRIDLGTSEQDLMQEGCVALLTAAERFDASLGCRFSTYATWWVRSALKKVVQEQTRMIRLPGRVHAEFSKIKRTAAELSARGDAQPSDEQVAQSLAGSSLTAERVRRITDLMLSRPASLDATLRGSKGSDDGRNTLADLIEDPDSIQDSVVKSMLCLDMQAAMEHHLELDERRVLVLRFGLADGVHRTVRQTGEEMGLAQKDVNKLLYAAMSKMRKPHVANALRQYLGKGGAGLRP